MQSPDTAGNPEQHFIALYEGGTNCILSPTSHVRRLLLQDRAPSEHDEQDVHSVSVCSLPIAFYHVDLGCPDTQLMKSSRKAMAVSLARPGLQIQQTGPRKLLLEGLSKGDDKCRISCRHTAGGPVEVRFFASFILRFSFEAKYLMGVSKASSRGPSSGTPLVHRRSTRRQGEAVLPN